MYNYEWDKETGGYILLPSKITGVTKEVRPVFHEELEFLGFDKNYGWMFPNCEGPLMWAEARRYFYKGELVGEATGGGLYDMPILKNVIRNLEIEPVDIPGMLEKNDGIMNGLVQTTLKKVYNTYLDYNSKVSMFYAAYSGGKDSIVMLDIVQRALPHDAFVVVFGDTTMELKVTYEALEKAKQHWETLEWHEACAPFAAEESWKKIGFPARKLRWCCSVHKTAPSIAKLKEIYKQKYPNAQRPFKVMVFDGVRAEESDARSTYSMISDGHKHAVQYNCSPILEWNSCELYLYIFKYGLLFNKLYRYGAYRVGCKLCPMASEWYECVINHIYPDEVKPLLDIVKENVTKAFPTETEENTYFQTGGWKSRIGGKELIIGGNKLLEIKTADSVKLILTDANYPWNKWMKTIGPVVQIDDETYSIQYKDINLDFKVKIEKNATTLILPALIRSPLSVRFMYLFKNALSKAAYCVNCGECMAECAFDALTITNDDICIQNCKHCEKCLDSNKGCIAARSLGITGGGNMSVKNISRYQNFGFRQEWLELYFETLDEFWTNERMGKYMLVGFKTWLKEAGITENNALTKLGNKLLEFGSDSPITWGVIYSNLCYESPIINWYARKIEVGRTYFADDLPILLGDEYSATVKKNALSSLKETLRLSPIGWLLLQGDCETKGKVVTSITKGSWYDLEPIVALYSLYLFAEHIDGGMYSFTLSDLFDDNEEREALSPRIIFGLGQDDMKPILQGLANNYPEFITVDFNKGIMENIDLPAGKNGKTALDVLSLI